MYTYLLQALRYSLKKTELLETAEKIIPYYQERKIQDCMKKKKNRVPKAAQKILYLVSTISWGGGELGCPLRIFLKLYLFPKKKH